MCKFAYSDVKTLPADVPQHLVSSALTLPKHMNTFLSQLLQVQSRGKHVKELTPSFLSKNLNIFHQKSFSSIERIKPRKQITLQTNILNLDFCGGKNGGIVFQENRLF